VVIAAGGSGGHIFPGLALAEELRGQAEVVFLGTEQGLEAKVVPQAGYPIRFIPARAVRVASVLGRLKGLGAQVGAVLGSRRLLRELSPQLVVGTGGYTSVGPVAAAKLLGIPALVLEQNVQPGLANRLLARLADAVAVTYMDSVAYLPKAKVHLTGNPVRPQMLSASRDGAHELFGLKPQRLTVLVLGGSSGARALNQAMVDALNYLLSLRQAVQFLHQSGQGDYQALREAYRGLGFHAVVSPFIYEMAQAYAVADLVLSRAGATTLAELTALGKPAVLVPYPHAGAHQLDNARKMAQMGAAVLLRQEELSGERLAQVLSQLLSSQQQRRQMALRSLAMGRPDAAKKVAELALSLLKQRGGRR
jgi:UDP-N-acetylglucosamine--N-acetylmuramyl-(pentapeptide) pyrophosphoryl-undecaprenol N-acetylglucosamine transferase